MRVCETMRSGLARERRKTAELQRYKEDLEVRLASNYGRMAVGCLDPLGRGGQPSNLPRWYLLVTRVSPCE